MLTEEYMPEVPGYRFESKMAEGGMGVVYRAVDETLGRTVAIKMIRHGLLGPGDERMETVSRFLREARAAAQIQSNHVAHVLQFGETDSGDLFLVLEYLSGSTLADVLRKEKRLPVQRAVRIMRQVCRGMEAAHRLGIVHRDLKPSNIMLIEQDGQPEFAKILDFGVAKVMGDQESGVTRSGMLVGTYTCMAPEQVNNEIIDARTDIYALAVMLFRMIAGRPLFAGNDFAVVLYHHVHTEAPSLLEATANVHIPRALDALVRRCLSKDPQKRVQTMAEFDRLLGESMIGQTELVSTAPAAATVVHDQNHVAGSTLLDELAPLADNDEIFLSLSASAPHPGPRAIEPTQDAALQSETHTQLRVAETLVSDEAETRSASFQLRGYDVLTNTSQRGPQGLDFPQEQSPNAPSVPTSVGGRPGDDFPPHLTPTQKPLARTDGHVAIAQTTPASNTWILFSVAGAVVFTAVALLVLSRFENEPILGLIFGTQESHAEQLQTEASQPSAYASTTSAEGPETPPSAARVESVSAPTQTPPLASQPAIAENETAKPFVDAETALPVNTTVPLEPAPAKPEFQKTVKTKSKARVKSSSKSSVKRKSSAERSSRPNKTAESASASPSSRKSLKKEFLPTGRGNN